MIESHLNERNQNITENLKYGQSITDACLGWDDTLMCLRMLNEAVIKKRGKQFNWGKKKTYHSQKKLQKHQDWSVPLFLIYLIKIN